MQVRSGDERFGVADLRALSALVADTWAGAADRDWSVPAGTLDWSCLRTADHAVDCTYAPAFFLASRRADRYPAAGSNLELGDAATPAELVESLGIATRLLVGAVAEADQAVRAVLFQRPEPTTGAPADFLPRAALELALHAHDVTAGLEVAFAVPADVAHRLREHTRPWPVWPAFGGGTSRLGRGGDPWADLLAAAGR